VTKGSKIDDWSPTEIHSCCVITVSPAYKLMASYDGEEDPGMLAFKAGEFTTALSQWNIRLRSTRYALNHSTNSEFRAIHLKTLFNLSLVCLKLEIWSECITHCDEALQFDPENEKTLYRKAVALRGRGCSEESLSCVKHMSKIYPENRAALALQLKLKTEIMELRASQSRMWSKSFSSKKRQSPLEKLIEFLASIFRKLVNFLFR
jgi:tetratricopeptide (TPR) repeat protein